jgi:hypothetical protein
MKSSKTKYSLIIAFLLLVSNVWGQDAGASIVTTDIDHFWAAYDKIVSTKDSLQQYAYLNEMFIEKGSPGLKAIMEARNYTSESYIKAIHRYPLFWNSVRANTFKAKDMAQALTADIEKIRKIYPDLKPSKIYFTVGALRTGGTTLDGMVLIGSEIAMADAQTVTTEFPNTMSHLAPYFSTNPIQNVAFGNTHEYIHTQQKTTIGDNLLAQCVLEGVAEFVAVIGTGKPSTAPAMDYGKQNDGPIRDFFSRQMFNSNLGFWLYNNEEHKFDNVRDLGYYVGYTICEKYYAQAQDKMQAIRQMITLDYNNQNELGKFVDQSRYFDQSMARARKDFEKNRPQVLGIKQFKNGSSTVNSDLKEITILFSKPMDEAVRNFELGPLGEGNLLRLINFVGFSEDKKAVTFEIALEQDRQYQIVVGSGFMSQEVNALSLRPYLIDFKTAKTQQ